MTGQFPKRRETDKQQEKREKKLEERQPERDPDRFDRIPKKKEK